MTMPVRTDGTICTLIKGFPLLLILAQNFNNCLNTPFVYKPPTPTQPPEYYHALEALYQHLFGHGHGHDEHHGYEHHGHEHGHGQEHNYHGHEPTYHVHVPNYHGHGHKYPSHGHGNKYPDHGHGNPMHGYGNQYPVYGTHKPGFSYPGYYNNHGHPGMYFKKCTNGKCTVLTNQSSSGYKNYAPNQTYHIQNKYKVVVKKNKRGHKRAGKLIKGN